MELTNINDGFKTKFILAEQYQFDPNCNTLVDIHDDKRLFHLGSNEGRILLALCIHQQKIVTREELLEFVWRQKGFEVDDSSLTQAVSVLRKVLKDSTKSPFFVKTVPKRGYQLICTVELVISRSPDKADIESTEWMISSENPDDSQPFDDDIQPEVMDSPEKGRRPYIVPVWLNGLFIALMLGLPLISYYLTLSPYDNVMRYATIDDVEIEVPDEQPELIRWLEQVDHCIGHYIRTYSDSQQLERVVVTGDPDREVMLNLIHFLPSSDKNQTLVFYSYSTPEVVCQTGV
ncbi:winged helix-turn-helix domain-containing protein [Vibrio proteolyticus]